MFVLDVAEGGRRAHELDLQVVRDRGVRGREVFDASRHLDSLDLITG